jgi:hypothetical protein
MNGLIMKAPDKRCCGSGVCIINQAGECWCGQVWDGEKMSAPPLLPAKTQAIKPDSEVDQAKPESQDPL